MGAFFWTGLAWGIAAIVLPRVARWGYEMGGSGWREWLVGIWLIVSGSALIFIAFVPLPLFLNAVPTIEPFSVLVSRYLAMLLVALGLYTSEFLKGWDKSRRTRERTR